ncbi:MAG: LamG-like jellyroll fold domain-containing protein [Acidimicrobiales bacterium]
MSYVNRRRRGGFGGVVGTTLVELVVAMAIFALIIGAVAGVVVMMQTQGIRSASAATAQNDGQTIETALAKAIRAVTVNMVGTPGGPAGTSTSQVNFFLACPYAAVFEATLPTPASPSMPETAVVYIYLTKQAGRPTYRIHVAATSTSPPTYSTTCPAGPGVTTMSSQTGGTIGGIGNLLAATQVLTDTGNVVATSPLFTYYDVTGAKLAAASGGTYGAVPSQDIASVGVHLQTRVVPSNGGTANANPSTSISNRIYLTNVADSSVPPAVQCYSSVVLADSPLAYWALNQPATVNLQPNTIVPDMSGNANRGTLHAGAAGGALPGPLKCDPTQTATSFAPNTTSDAEPDLEQGVYDEPTTGSGDFLWADKTGGYMSTYMKQANLTSYTIAAWIKTGVLPQGWATILSARGSLGGCNGGLSLNIASAGQPFAILDANCYPPIGVVDNGVNLADNQWHFVVATWTGVKYAPITANQFSLYVDGKLASTTAVGNPGWTGPMAPFTSSGTVSVGWNGSAYWYRFIGDIAQVSVYNYPLSPQQTATQFLAACPPPAGVTPGTTLGHTCPRKP